MESKIYLRKDCRGEREKRREKGKKRKKKEKKEKFRDGRRDSIRIGISEKWSAAKGVQALRERSI